ncbi:aminomethyl-transferring glycine dehydrogenase [Brackiella oedipodis]|uniref:aminomethyl-transferring glycine dehydrogenase n=1 Tax=Brackiella oedipodis TaxID=124225 RepID=UPI00048F3FFA|nr:aminomethyl-transferring glycine dehydrogenase [Brackiella oedipodis]
MLNTQQDVSRGFIHRHIGPAEEDLAKMLKVVGTESLDTLVDEIVPANIRLQEPLALDPARSEVDVLAEIRRIALQNKVYRNYIGQGYYGTLVPHVILRNILENPAWYTAYTPYQPEISQGRLEALLNFQTMVADLTALDIANASLLDEGTAAAEAMTLAKRGSRSKSNVFFVSQFCHPQTQEVIKTRAKALGIEVVVGDERRELPDDYFAVIVQYPQSQGEVVDYSELAQTVHDKKALLIAATDLLALCVLQAPGEWGADIAVGNSQRFGVPLGFGGPHAAFLACKDAFKRNMPGRLVGVSKDAQGNYAYRLALQTREQHIRREKATSNICTAQALLAIMASMYAIFHGPQGLRKIAQRVYGSTAVLKAGLEALGLQVKTQQFFDTLTIESEQTPQILKTAEQHQINLRELSDQAFAISLDETVTLKDLQALLDVIAEALGATKLEVQALADKAPQELPSEIARQSEILAHEIFSSVRSETDMLRYLRRLADKDLALDRSMIPLGSCTMKLNATTEMMPITWPEFSNIHPFAPKDQTQGYEQLIKKLSAVMCEISGYDGFTVQPNSGAQGEYAGLLAIRAYHQANGQEQRRVCLIPASAHGTNPASAHLAGMEVVVVKSDANGNVDLEDLDLKIEKVGDTLAAILITYPSTHGVFEEKIVEICDKIHKAGGQVYLDGANMNAMVGIAKPGKFGSDVSHFNLHKTFCIPHGGGGPGVGPIGVGKHLIPYLPGVVNRHGELHDAPVGPVASAPYGSASILPISLSYILMMGQEGLRKASQVALLNANYIATRLSEHYPILYKGRNGRVAHECILDLRGIKQSAGVTVDDVAKRLIDFGFHAPTMSFPVPDTLMVEPTESESLAELDRFIDAMIQIRTEIQKVEDGEFDATDNVLRNAPHTSAMASADDWSHPYTRKSAVFPPSVTLEGKYWSPVARVDNAYGDRNLICSCLPIEAYMDQD